MTADGFTGPGPDDDAPAVPARRPSRTRRWSKRGLRWLGAAVGLWLLAAYLVAPFFWTHYEHNPAMIDAPRVAVTAQGIPGDPLNVGLIGSREDLIRAMAAAEWAPADPVTIRTSLEIAGSVLRGRPYADAPVSPLFVFGRKQDLAFEKPVGDSARRRHHVRFWRSVELGAGGEPLWIGAATFDRSVGLSHRTGQITHHIAPDVDAERDGLIADVRGRGRLVEVFQVTGVGATLFGRNGGGDPYYTDGEMTVGVLAPAAGVDGAPRVLDNPPVIRLKEQLWSAVKPMIDALAPDDPGEGDGDRP